jgi:hypothetical protein
MFMMIFVNDLAGAGRVLPDWMVHYSDRHRGGSGMTFVDLVFPAFLFIVGMSVPLALGGRLAKGEPVWRIIGHVFTRTLSLLAIGIQSSGRRRPLGALRGVDPGSIHRPEPTWLLAQALKRGCRAKAAKGVKAPERGLLPLNSILMLSSR